jgi:hypothetical protein
VATREISQTCTSFRRSGVSAGRRGSQSPEAGHTRSDSGEGGGLDTRRTSVN